MATAAADLWRLVDHEPTSLERLAFRGPTEVLPSSFAVTEAAAILVGVASLALSDLASLRAREVARPVIVDRLHAAIAFQSERHLRVARSSTQLWDPLSGFYEARDGHVQLHTNFAHHRTRMLDALELDRQGDRAQVADAVAVQERFAVEDAVVSNGGIAAAVRSPEEWDEHPHARETPPVIMVRSQSGRPAPLPATSSDRPLAGLRVLDLTRVIAGPVCTRTLAAYGADVLRVGHDSLPVVDAVLPDTTLGKRFCHVDLTTVAGRDVLLRLAQEADVVVTGFRPGALAARGIDHSDMLDANPSLVIADLSAFGRYGPWGGRRGFDSITQAATGIVAEERQAFGEGEPRALPCQLLDHGSGFLLTLGVLTGLLRRHHEGGVHVVEVSLLGTRNWLDGLGRRPHTEVEPPSESVVAAHTMERATKWGPITHVRHPDPINAIPPRWDVGPTDGGSHEPVWLARH